MKVRPFWKGINTWNKAELAPRWAMASLFHYHNFSYNKPCLLVKYNCCNCLWCTWHFCWCTAVAPPQSETNGLNTGLFLSLPTWLHAPAREEVHSDPEGGRGGLRVSPPRFPQGHDHLVERGWAPEGQQEVGYCTHCCLCYWWHLVKVFLMWSHSFVGLMLFMPLLKGTLEVSVA